MKSTHNFKFSFFFLSNKKINFSSRFNEDKQVKNAWDRESNSNIIRKVL
jgi:hypothetical protein